MGIKRTRSASNFTTVNNEYLQDKLLSWKAKGMISYLMSLPDDWEINIKDLQGRSKDGRDATANTLKEIINSPYGRRLRARSGSGLFEGYDYEVCDSKAFNPNTDNPDTDNANTDNPEQVNTNPTKNSPKKKLSEQTVQTDMFATEQPHPNKKTLFRNSAVANTDVFAKKLDEAVQLGVDVTHYYQAVNNWSDMNTGIKRDAKGWLATAKQFMLRDKQQGKLAMSVASSQVTQEQIDYLNI
jgi:hypothetical protein